MLDNSWFGDHFATMRVMAILRGMGVDRTLDAAVRAWDQGITAVEVPIQTAPDVEALRAVVQAGTARGMVVGAGTVTTVEQAEQAARAGAGYTVAPGLDLSIAEESHRLGMPHLPGVGTATEVQRAVGHGLTWLKAFPAAVLGEGWFRAMAGPFPGVRFVATGGLRPADVPGLLAAGVSVVAVGSALLEPAAITELSGYLGESGAG